MRQRPPRSCFATRSSDVCLFSHLIPDLDPGGLPRPNAEVNVEVVMAGGVYHLCSGSLGASAFFRLPREAPHRSSSPALQRTRGG